MSQPKPSVKISLVLAFMTGLISGCGTAPSTSSTSAKSTQTTVAKSSAHSNTLVIGYLADATSLDPAQITDINSGQVTNNMYQTLVRWSFTKKGKLVPNLATSWKVNKTGTIYTFSLRKGVRFSDGTPFNANAVVFSFERMLNPKNPYYKYGPFPPAKFDYGNIKTVKALTTSTVQFILKQPEASFVTSLTIGTGSIVNPAAVKKYKAKFPLHGGGTGPFMLSLWQKGVKLVLKPNPYYWGTKPKLSRVVFIPIPQGSQRDAELQSGAANFIINPNPAALSGLKKQGFLVNAVPGPHIWWIGMNLTKPPFNNPLVRQALNYAINRTAITKGILYGTGVPADQPLANMQLGYNANVNHYHYNPKKAKALLAKAGYPHGFTTTLLVPTSGSGMQNPRSMGTAIQGYLGAIGVHVKIQQLDWGTYLSRVGAGAKKSHLDMWELSWMDSAVDPSHVFGPLLSASSFPPGFNSGYYNNPTVNKLLTQAEMTTSNSKRKVLYAKVSQLVNHDAPWIFVDHGKSLVAYNKTVHGFKLNPTFPFLIWLDPVSIK